MKYLEMIKGEALTANELLTCALLHHKRPCFARRKMVNRKAKGIPLAVVLLLSRLRHTYYFVIPNC